VARGNSEVETVTLSGDFGPSSIYIKAFVASSPSLRTDRYAVGAAFTIYFNEKTNRGGTPQSGLNKDQVVAQNHFCPKHDGLEWMVSCHDFIPWLLNPEPWSVPTRSLLFRALSTPSARHQNENTKKTTRARTLQIMT